MRPPNPETDPHSVKRAQGKWCKKVHTTMKSLPHNTHMLREEKRESERERDRETESFLLKRALQILSKVMVLLYMEK